MKTHNCCFPECERKAVYYCGYIRHKSFGKITAGWCDKHHPNFIEVEKHMDKSMINKTDVYENRMGILRYNKTFIRPVTITTTF